MCGVRQSSVLFAADIINEGGHSIGLHGLAALGDDRWAKLAESSI